MKRAARHLDSYRFVCVCWVYATLVGITRKEQFRVYISRTYNNLNGGMSIDI